MRRGRPTGIRDSLAGLSRHPAAEWLSARIKWLAELGTDGYPPHVRRRLLILNLFAYLIAVTTAGYALQQIQLDFDTYKPLVFINLALLVMALTVPAMHRINEIAGGMLIVVSEYIALMAFTAYLGHSAGIHLQYIIAGAAAFVVFGLERLKLVTTVSFAPRLVLHLVAWFKFPPEAALIKADQGCSTRSIRRRRFRRSASSPLQSGMHSVVERAEARPTPSSISCRTASPGRLAPR